MNFKKRLEKIEGQINTSFTKVTSIFLTPLRSNDDDREDEKGRGWTFYHNDQKIEVPRMAGEKNEELIVRASCYASKINGEQITLLAPLSELEISAKEKL